MAALGNGEPPSRRELVTFLADHESGGSGASPLCIHPSDDDRFGTSSASIVQVGADREVQRFAFCSGPPCAGHWNDLTEACRTALGPARRAHALNSAIDPARRAC
jgi:hypothetical protein